MYKILVIFISCCSLSGFGQNKEILDPSPLGQNTVSDSIPADPLYREDQFYFNITYNLVRNVPSGVELRGLTGGLALGYIRDMPINKRRNVALGIGMGLAFNQYGQNLFIGESQIESTIFSILDGDTNFDKNRFSTTSIELPLELRWRSSTSKRYKFWRVYTGVRVSYTYWYRSFFTQENNEVSQTNISEFQPISISPTFSFGFNKINFFASYTVTPFYKDAQTTQGQKVGFNPLKLGLIFYVL